MYQVFLGYMPLPITPSKIETKINGRNSTIELINGQEVNIIKGQGLIEISFEFMIPHQAYPFASLAGQATNLVGSLMNPTVAANYYGTLSTAMLEYLEYLKTGTCLTENIFANGKNLKTSTKKTVEKIAKKFASGEKDNSKTGEPFQFIVARVGEGFSITNAYNTNLKVTLEDYQIIEDASNGLDIMVSVNLKQYVPYYTKVYNSNKLPAKKAVSSEFKLKFNQSPGN